MHSAALFLSHFINMSCSLKRAGESLIGGRTFSEYVMLVSCSLAGRVLKKGPRSGSPSSSCPTKLEMELGVGRHYPLQSSKETPDKRTEISHFLPRPPFLEKAAHLRPSTIFMGASRERAKTFMGSKFV